MAIPTSEGVTETGREAYLQELYQKAIGGDEDSCIELGRIASGRVDIPLARELFGKLENRSEEAQHV